MICPLLLLALNAGNTKQFPFDGSKTYSARLQGPLSPAVTMSWKTVSTPLRATAISDTLWGKREVLSLRSSTVTQLKCIQADNVIAVR